MPVHTWLKLRWKKSKVLLNILYATPETNRQIVLKSNQLMWQIMELEKEEWGFDAWVNQVLQLASLRGGVAGTTNANTNEFLIIQQPQIPLFYLDGFNLAWKDFLYSIFESFIICAFNQFHKTISFCLLWFQNDSGF